MKHQFRNLSIQFQKANRDYINQLKLLCEYESDYRKAELEVTAKKFQIIRDNPDKALGNNEKDREAELERRLKDDKAQLEVAKSNIQEVKSDIEISKAKLNALKFQLECLKPLARA